MVVHVYHQTPISATLVMGPSCYGSMNHNITVIAAKKNIFGVLGRYNDSRGVGWVV